MRKGASHIHVVTDFLLGLEGEVKSLKAESVNPSEGTRREAHTRYAETTADELEEFVAAEKSVTMDPNDLIEGMDSEVAINLISSELLGHQQQ